jgi:uncharacterized protein YheU (UPF0270 family)
MSEGTTPGKEEVELRQEQQPRATQEQLPRGTDYGADGRKMENTVSRFLHFSITYLIEKWQYVRDLRADCCFAATC